MRLWAIQAPARAQIPAAIPLHPLKLIKRLLRSIIRLMSTGISTLASLVGVRRRIRALLDAAVLSTPPDAETASITVVAWLAVSATAPGRPTSPIT